MRIWRRSIANRVDWPQNKGWRKFLSLKHFAAYIDIVASSYRVALVLEDDAAFAFSSPDDAAAYMDLILSEADGIDYDILMLGTCSGAAPSSMYDEQITANIWRATESTCSHAYLVTLSGAEKMLKSLPFCVPQ